MGGFFIFGLFVFILNCSIAIQRNDKFLERRNRMMKRRIREDFMPKVCFDHLGCFADPPQRLTLKRPPEHPNVIQTQFLLYTRINRLKQNKPEILKYDDASNSITKSHFNGSNALKIIAHGFKGSGSNVGVITAANLHLDLDDVNVIIVDWTKGAGTTYQAAVANTELVGRQLALILLDAIKLGTKLQDIHIAGFSLGAHVAGCASEVLKSKKLLLGRITGLDPASPFFRHHVLRERSRKLDVSDARLVDVIHTDGSEVFTDGFGLLRPIGHIDFFPNGGRQQPGCTDIKNSIVYSHLHEDLLDRSIACSHLRAWHLYLASIQSQLEECRFIGWPCPRRVDSFAHGNCFPLEDLKQSQEMGFAADRGSLGSYYLPTRRENPFCGDAFRASVVVSRDALGTLGTLFIKINHGNTSTIFEINCNLYDCVERQLTFFAIAAVTFKAINQHITTINGSIWYQATIIDELQEEVSTRPPRSPTLIVDKFAIEDRKGNRWEYCKENLLIGENAKHIDFQRGICKYNP